MTRVHVTRRALREIGEIDRYSIDRWGDDVARQYLADLFDGMTRLESAPGLLRRREDVSLRLLFYRVREHALICDVLRGDIFVLAVWHGQQDVASRLEDLEPQLVHEAELMAHRIEGADRDAADR